MSYSDPNKYYVGFWKESAHMGWIPGARVWTELPVANTSSLSSDQQTQLIHLLKRAEQVANRTEYFGFSTCRLCGICNGGEEFEWKGFVWPSGYMHYLLEHHVQMDERFEAFLRMEFSR